MKKQIDKTIDDFLTVAIYFRDKQLIINMSSILNQTDATEIGIIYSSLVLVKNLLMSEIHSLNFNATVGTNNECDEITFDKLKDLNLVECLLTIIKPKYEILLQTK